MGNRFEPNRGGVDDFQKHLDLQFKTANERARNRLDKGATVDDAVTATVEEFAKIGVAIDPTTLRAEYEQLLSDADEDEQS